MFKLLWCIGILTILLSVYSSSFENFEGEDQYQLIPHHIPAKKPRENTHSSIPKKVYMSWKTRELPPIMYKTVLTNSENNPEYDFYVFSDEECREFIVANYDADTVAAFDSLIPGAYKSDLWRYCILYKLGGIYMDIKFKIDVPLNHLTELNENLLVKDRPEHCIYQGVAIVKPGLHIFMECINQIKIHVKTKFYGELPLHPTGPRLLGDIIEKNNMQNLVKLILVLSPTPTCPERGIVSFIHSPEHSIFSAYEEYGVEKNNAIEKHGWAKYYYDLWISRNIYST